MDGTRLLSLNVRQFSDMSSSEPTRLPFFERPDLSPFLVHLTKNTKKEDGYTAFKNLINILRTGEIWGSDKAKGFIKGLSNATCFMDVPLTSLKYVLNKSNTDPDFPRYEPYGVIVSKKYAYSKGGTSSTISLGLRTAGNGDPRGSSLARG